MILTPTEQRVYRYFYNKKVFSLDEVNSVVKNYRTAIHVAKGLFSKRYCQRIKGGLYFVVPFETSPDTLNEFKPDKYLIGSRLKGFLSHHTALELYNAASHDFNKVFVTSDIRIPNLMHKDVNYLCIKTKHYFGFKEINYNNQNILISDKERTVLDCIRNLNYTNGLNEILNAIPKLAPLNFELMFQYLKKIDEQSLFAKTGYIFEYLKNEISTPNWFLDKLKGYIKNKTYYLDNNVNSKHVREWRLMVPV